MKPDLEDGKFISRNRDELISNINAYPDQFKETLRIALKDEPQAWNAAWLLEHCVMKNDPRIREHVFSLIQAIKGKRDGHQREILKILRKMDLKDDQEGYLFDECMNIWESVGKSPSVRITTFSILADIAKKYPELRHELEFLTQNQYTETLSPGIRLSFDRIWAGI
jgi:hypothetical protein